MGAHVHRDGEPTILAARIARNVRRLREQRGQSHGDLAALAGIDSATVAKIESAKGEPPLELAWRIAHALGIPFSALIADQAARGTVVVRKEQAPNFASQRLGLSSRALLPHDRENGVEFYELRLAPRYRENCAPHAAGTREALHVTKGRVEVSVGQEAPQVLQSGDTIRFAADLRHAYENLGDEPALLYLIITYPEAST